MRTKKPAPTIAEIKEKVRPVLERYHARKAGVFGSLVHGKMRSRSDIDILVEFSDTIGLFDFVGLKQELEEILGRKVDLVQYRAIKPLIKERILAEEVPIYEKR